jgi:hypothetical protein
MAASSGESFAGCKNQDFLVNRNPPESLAKGRFCMANALVFTPMPASKNIAIPSNPDVSGSGIAADVE